MCEAIGLLHLPCDRHKLIAREAMSLEGDEDMINRHECSRGALAIEHEIDRQIERLGKPIPSRILAVDSNGSYAGGLEIIYTRSDGEQVTAEFSTDEVEAFRRNPLPETTEKIASVAALLCNAQGRRQERRH